ncbi:MAG: L-threonylcarbamoyladenylate synthase [Armatimonadetes bacterium]|nr:L-threonylcarbamoyladenylate synthase [Armatimonadota bacterium]
MIVLKVDAINPYDEAVRRAAEAIRRGELVIFPTETVYGLAADALNVDAVRRVFDAKGRAEAHPLPVQIASVEQLAQIASEVSEDARVLATRYWPGPLTLVLPKNPTLPDLVTGGAETIGVRVPDHPVALALLRELGQPIVASSANKSGGEPPRDAEEAIGQLGQSVSVVLDAGPCRIGVASTVVDVSVRPARILRQGAISETDILGAIKELD